MRPLRREWERVGSGRRVRGCGAVEGRASAGAGAGAGSDRSGLETTALKRFSYFIFFNEGGFFMLLPSEILEVS